MADLESLNIYDAAFDNWLEKRVKRLPSGLRADRVGAPRHFNRVDVTALLRAEFDAGKLARLNALGLAT